MNDLGQNKVKKERDSNLAERGLEKCKWLNH